MFLRTGGSQRTGRGPNADATIRRLLSSAVVVAAALSLAPRVRAKGSVQALGELAVGWTDNVFGAPWAPFPPGTLAPCDPKPTNACPAGAPLPRYSDFFFELRPGVAFTTAAPRFVQRLSAAFAADVFTVHDNANSYTGTIDWAAYALPSKNTELLVTLQSQEGQLNTVNLQSAAGESLVTVLGATKTTFFSQSLGETLLWHVTNRWNAIESLSFRGFWPISPRDLPSTYDTTLTLGGERVFRRDAVGLELRSDYIAYGEVRDPNTDVVLAPSQHQLIESLIARWRRDLTRFWSTELAAGVIAAFNAANAHQAIWQPYGLAAVRYFRQLASAELRYEHNVLPNPLAGGTYVVDGVALRGAMPISQRARLLATATVGYEHARLVDLAIGGTAGSAEVVVADAALAWQALPWLALFARYALIDQLNHPDETPSPQPAILRNTIMLGVAGAYPPLAAARVPRQPSLRVDRNDMALIPEPHSQPFPK